MTTSTDELMKLLPISYPRNKESNWYKIVDLFGYQLDKLKTSTQRISNWKNIDESGGKALEEIGKEYGVPRTTNDDEFYRFLIKSHIEMSLRVGTINDLIHVLANTSGIDPSAFDVRNGEEPMSVKVLNMPTALTPDESQRQLVIDWIEAVLPAGVRLEEISFRSASESEIMLGIVIESAAWFKTPVANMSVEDL